jgi:hypothetical protein
MSSALRPRKTVRISDSIHRQLNMYALAASAAGVGMLALAEPAEAKIVYTPTREKLINFFVSIDLNHDGKADMSFANLGGGRSGSYYSFLSARYANLSTTPEFVDTGKGFAVALHAGEQIGPQKQFRSAGVLWNEKVIHSFTNHSTRTSWSGQWANGGKGLKDRYLGIKFAINGKFHYGWARVSVTISESKVTSLLTGYAYETIPNKPIVAGKTKGSDIVTVPPDAGQGSLGRLAMGRE